MELPKGVWEWIFSTKGAIVDIAKELEKLRLLREYELGAECVRDAKSGKWIVSSKD